MKSTNLYTCLVLSSALSLNLVHATEQTELDLLSSKQETKKEIKKEAQKETQIETITVLGVSNAENANLGGIELNQLPLNAHVVGQIELERLRFVDPNELLDRIPGETQVRNLRIPDGGKSYTLAYVDGVPIESPYGGATQRLDRVNTSEIQRVEVIKGPTSALFANNVFGGVVNVVTQDISEETQAGVSAEFGNFNRERFDVNYSAKAGNLGYAFNVNTRRLDGLREGTQNDRDVGSLKLVYDFNENTRLTTRLERFEEVTELRGDLTSDQINQDPTQAGTLDSAEDLIQDTVSFALRHTLSSGELNAVLLNRVQDTIGLSRFSGPQDSTDDAINLITSYKHNLNNGSLLIGYDRYDGEVDTKSFGRTDIELLGDFTESRENLEIDAIYTQYQTSLTKNLRLIAGLRHEEIDLSSDINGGLQADFSSTAPKLGLTYELSERSQIWFSASEGLYAPDLDDLFDEDEGNPNLNPEESLNIEFGFRGSWNNWAYDASIYHNEIENYLVTQEFVNNNGNEFELTTNAGQITVKGIEAVVEYSPSEANWRAGLTYTLSENRFDSFVQSVAGADDDFSGNELRRTPRHHLNARLAWEPISNLIAELEGDFYSSYFSDDANSSQGRFQRDERINLRLTYDIGRWSIWLSALNITDTLEDRGTFSRGRLAFRTVDGRTYYAGLSYRL